AIGAARVAAIEPATRRIAADLMRRLVALREADFVEQFSSPLPAYVFGEWMGLTETQTRVLWTTARVYVKAWEAFDKSSVQVASEQLYKLAGELIVERRCEPRDPQVDPTSSLL